MRVVSGHLTATNKKAIKAILAAGLTEGKVGNTSYQLHIIDGVHQVKMYTKDRGMIPCPGSALRVSTYLASFIL